MIHKTPELHIEARELLNNGEWYSEPLKSRFSDYEVVFVSLHPFLKINEGSTGLLQFTPETWPSRQEIEEHCEALSWNEVIHNSEFNDIAELDRGLAAYHTARMWSLEGEHSKLNRYLTDNQDSIVPAQVDFLPEIQEKLILDNLKNIGVKRIFVYSDVDPKPVEALQVEEWNTGFANIPFQVRVESADSKFLLVEDFDQRYTYIAGSLTAIESLVEKSNLEGFYCDEATPAFWSYTGRPKEKNIESGVQNIVNWIRKKTTHNNA